MCGIAGLFTKTDALRSQLGGQLAAMLTQLSDRVPDSAGVAFYRAPAPPGWCKVSLHSPAGDPAWTALSTELAGVFGDASQPSVRDSHAVLQVPGDAADVQEWLVAQHPELTLMSVGQTIEIFKEAGLPT